MKDEGEHAVTFVKTFSTELKSLTGLKTSFQRKLNLEFRNFKAESRKQKSGKVHEKM